MAQRRDTVPITSSHEKAGGMTQSTQERNKALGLQAFDLLFNKRDYVAAEKYWSPHYIPHSAHIAPGREGLFNLIKSIPPNIEVRTRSHRGRGRFRDRARAIFRLRTARKLDRRGHSSNQGWNPCRALGRDPGR